jgi:FKBP-type peptidyl-prolyl cis-trans isomerase
MSRAEGDEVVDTRPLEFFDGRWHQPIDTMEHLLVNYSYSPARHAFNFDAVAADKLMYDREDVSENKYQAGEVYANINDLDRRINEALVERFGAGISYDDVLEADSVNTKSTVKVWYIGRFLDGFIFDTNIDEVKEII